MGSILFLNKHGAIGPVRILYLIALLFTPQVSFSALPNVRELSVRFHRDILSSHSLYFSFDISGGTTTPNDGTSSVLGYVAGAISDVGISSSAYRFDGINDFMDVRPPFGFSAPTPIVFEAYVKPTTGLATTYPIIYNNDVNASAAFSLLLSQSGQARVVLGQHEQMILSSGPTLMDGNFHYVAFAKRGGTGEQLELYVDDQLVANGVMPAPNGTGGNAGLGIGTGLNNTFFLGTIDEVGIISVTLPTIAEMIERGRRHLARKSVRNIPVARVNASVR